MDVPDALVEARAEEMIDRFMRQLQGRGIDPETFMQVQESGREGMIADAKADAERSLKREAVIVAIAEAEDIDVSEEEMLEALKPGPGHEDHGHDPPEVALAKLRESGRETLLREDLRLRKAVDLVAESAVPIPLEQAEAREAIWTPDKEREAASKEGGGESPPDKLWTPGS